MSEFLPLTPPTSPMRGSWFPRVIYGLFTSKQMAKAIPWTVGSLEADSHVCSLGSAVTFPGWAGAAFWALETRVNFLGVKEDLDTSWPEVWRVWVGGCWCCTLGTHSLLIKPKNVHVFLQMCLHQHFWLKSEIPWLKTKESILEIGGGGRGGNIYFHVSNCLHSLLQISEWKGGKKCTAAHDTEDVICTLRKQ